LHFPQDDGIVVPSGDRLRAHDVPEYLTGEETNRPQELTYGVLREPPTPTFEHQMMVGALYDRLNRHVRTYRLGRVVLSPMDVILDVDRALVVQPDVLFVSTEREAICRDRIWGAAGSHHRSPVTGQPAPRSHRQSGVV
jgi:hypothetical protein